MAQFLILPGEMGSWEIVSISNITRGSGELGKWLTWFKTVFSD